MDKERYTKLETKTKLGIHNREKLFFPLSERTEKNRLDQATLKINFFREI